MIECAKYFDSNNTMSFKVSDKIWGKISSLIGKAFDSGPVYDDSDKYIKTKIKSQGDKTNTHFQGRKLPKENTS